MKKKLYIGCSIYNASEAFLQEIKEFKQSLSQNFEVLDFVPPELQTDATTPQDIVKHDLSQVRSCDLLVGICDHPSLGLGIEIGTANAMQKPIILAAQNTNISRMIRGNDIENPNSTFTTYANLSDLIPLIKSTAQTL